MTIQEASERYRISLHILREYERWGLCRAVKDVMGAWQYDQTDIERLSRILTLHDVGFAPEEVEHYMRLLLAGDSTKEERAHMLKERRDGTLELSDYDTILLSYPIWWGTMPRILNTFLDIYDLSGISPSLAALKEAAPGADVRDGLRASSPEDSSIAAWLSQNGLTES